MAGRSGYVQKAWSRIRHRAERVRTGLAAQKKAKGTASQSHNLESLEPRVMLSAESLVDLHHVDGVHIADIVQELEEHSVTEQVQTDGAYALSDWDDSRDVDADTPHVVETQEQENENDQDPVLAVAEQNSLAPDELLVLEQSSPVDLEAASPLSEKSETVQIKEQRVEVDASKREGFDSEDAVIAPAQPDVESISDQLVETLRSANGPPAVVEHFDSLSLTHDNGSLTLLSNGVRPLDLLIGLQDDHLSIWDADQLISDTPLDDLAQISVIGSAAYDDVLAIDFHADVELDFIYEGGDGGYDVLDLSGVGIGSYTPGAVFGDGFITAGLSTILFTGLEPVFIDGSAQVNGNITAATDSSFTFTTPRGADDILIDTPEADQTRISGTSDGDDFESITFKNIANVIIDTGANDVALSSTLR